MTNVDREPFLQHFFGTGNVLNWDKFCSGEMTANAKNALEPWVEQIRNGTQPYFLPRVDPTTKLTTWYAFCDDTQGARGLRELLFAFVGPTFARFDGQLACLDIDDEVDVACRKEFGSLVFKLPILTEKDRRVVAKKLELINAFRMRMPTHNVSTPKPIGRLLRDLEMAIVVNNEPSAWRLYDEIKSRGRVSSSNLSFLQVTVYAAFDRWQDILGLPQLDDLLRVTRPKRVTEAIAAAVYQIHLEKHAADNDIDGVVETFRAFNGKFDSIFKTIRGIERADSLKAVLVSAIASIPPRIEQAKTVAEKPALRLFQPWCERLVGFVQSEVPVAAPEKTTEDQANESYENDDFDRAFALYLECDPTPQTVRRALEIAVEINTLDAASYAISFYESSTTETQENIQSRRTCRRHLDELQQLVVEEKSGTLSVVGSWFEWLELVDQGDQIENAVELAQQHSKEWNCAEVVATASRASEFAKLIAKGREGMAREVVRNAMPHLVSSFIINLEPTRIGKPIYLALTDVLIYDESIGPDDLTAVEQLIEAVLTSAPSHEEPHNDFMSSVEIVEYLWSSVASARNLDWAIGMIDLFIDVGAANHANPAGVYTKVIDSVQGWKRRVTDEQWSMLELLGGDLGFDNYLNGIKPVETDIETTEIEIGNWLDGKSIAVFSLTERIAKRFGQMAEALFTGIKLHYVHDKSLTDRMKSLSKSADIFIVNTWDAKHAATNGIKDNRPLTLVTLEPEGKSASSLLRCLKRYAESLLE